MTTRLHVNVSRNAIFSNSQITTPRIRNYSSRKLYRRWNSASCEIALFAPKAERLIFDVPDFIDLCCARQKQALSTSRSRTGVPMRIVSHRLHSSSLSAHESANRARCNVRVINSRGRRGVGGGDNLLTRKLRINPINHASLPYDGVFA